MSEPTTSVRSRGERTRDILGFLFFAACALVPVVVAMHMTVLGRFLSYGGLTTSQPDAVFFALLAAAIHGPTLIAMGSIVGGVQRYLAGRRGAFAVPLLGAASIPVLYGICGALIAA